MRLIIRPVSNICVWYFLNKNNHAPFIQNRVYPVLTLFCNYCVIFFQSVTNVTSGDTHILTCPTSFYPQEPHCLINIIRVTSLWAVYDRGGKNNRAHWRNKITCTTLVSVLPAARLLYFLHKELYSVHNTTLWVSFLLYAM